MLSELLPDILDCQSLKMREHAVRRRESWDGKLEGDKVLSRVRVNRDCRARDFVDIDDLDRGLRTHIDYTTRSYTEDSFPEPPLEGVNGIGIGKLKPTGRRRKIAGYSCEEYRGSGESAHWGVSTEVDCISTDAPGVAEFDQVINLLRPLYQKAGYSDFTRETLDYPDFVPYAPPHGVSGIPLESLIDCCGGLSGYAVTRIELRNIPASAFEPPAGFMKMCDGRCD